MKVTSNLGWSVNKVGGDGWLTVSPASGSGDGEVSFEAEPNTGASTRTAIVTITADGVSDQVISVRQSGYGYLTVSKTKLLYSPKQETQEFTITSNVEWNIIIANGEGWLDVSMKKGNGNNNIKVTASDNSGNSSPRSAVITVKGEGLTQTIEVKQDGYGYLTVNTTSLRYNPEAGEKVLKIESNVNWTIDKGDGTDWLELSPTNKDVSGNDITDVTVKVTDNTGSPTPRMATLRIDGDNGLTQTIEVKQDGYGYLTVNTTSLRYNPEVGEKVFKIESNVNWKIEKEQGVDWIEVSPEERSDIMGNDTTEVTVKVKDNTGSPSPRYTTITIKSAEGLTQEVKVTQEGTANFTIDKTIFRFSTDGGSDTLNITSNVDWKVDCRIISGSDDWISVVPSDPNKDDGTIEITTRPNTGNASREATISIEWSDGTTTHAESVSVIQYGNAHLIPSTDEVFFGNPASSNTITIEHNVDWTIDVEYVEGDKWLTVSPLEGEANEPQETKIEITVAENTTRESRTANINIHWNDGARNIITTVRVTQNDQQTELSLDKDRIPFGLEGGVEMFTVTSNANWTVSCSDPSWLTATPKNGTGVGDVRLKVDPTNQTAQRTATVKVELEDQSRAVEIKIIQSGNAKLVVAPDSLNFTVKDSKQSLNIKDCNVDWRVYVREGASWLKIEEPAELKGEGNGAIKLHADFNENTESGRSGVMCVRYLGPDGDSITIDIPITQDRCPIVPEELLLVDSLYTPDGVVESTILKSVNLVVDTTGYDNSSKWKFEWLVNGDKQSSETNSLDYIFEDRQMYPVAVKIKYEDDPENEVLQQSMEFELYTAPPAPDKLVKKGNGTSGIMIAEFEENAQFAQNFNGQYEFVFGYDDTQEGTTSNRYYQYRDKALVTDETVEKWVYTQWEIEVGNNIRTIQSKNKRSSTGKSIPNTTRSTTNVDNISSNHLEMSGNRLRVSLPNSTSASVAVMSMSGVVVRNYDLSSNDAINETLDFYELPPGAYIVKCSFGEQGIVKKIVIK